MYKRHFGVLSGRQEETRTTFTPEKIESFFGQNLDEFLCNCFMCNR